MKALLLAAAAIVSSTGIAAWADADMDAGTRLYNAGHYAECVTYFNHLVAMHPANAVAHYYLANALLKLRRNKEAADEYGLCYWLDPKGEAASYSWKALKSLTSAANTGESLTSVMQMVHKQAVLEKDKEARIARAGALSQTEIGNIEAQKIQADADSEIERVMTPQPTQLVPYVQGLSRGFVAINTWDPVAAKAKADQIRQSAESAQKLAREKAQERADEYKKIGQTRQSSVDDTVSGIESQLNLPDSPGVTKLRPVGTNLYVRFYGYGKGSGTQSGSEDEKHSLAQKEAQSLGRSAQAGALSIPVAQHAHETQGSFELDNKHQAAKIVRGKIIR